jgi:uncharacterized membrane protein YhdT
MAEGEKKIHAKESSLFAQIVAAMWIAGWCSFAFLSGKQIAVIDVILSGVGIAAMFLPVYFSIIMYKVKEIKLTK